MSKSYLVLFSLISVCALSARLTAASFDDTRLTTLSGRLNTFIPQQFLGGAIFGDSHNNTYTYTAGFIDTAKTKPFNSTTIIRMASDTKLVGTVAFLRLIERGLITGYEPLKTWIPAFANSTVISPVENPCNATLYDSLSVSTGSKTLTIEENKHGRKVGDLVGISASTAIGNISTSILNNLFTVTTVINKNKYTVTLPAASNVTDNDTGGAVVIFTLPDDAKQTIWKNKAYYYTTVPLVRDALIWHVLTHTLGYEYVILGEMGGYADNSADADKRKVLASIQAGIYTEKGIPMPYPIPNVPGTFNTIQEWTNAMASVPLLFQPGEQWSYGPTLSILGALIEAIDGRSVENYVRDEVSVPLGMIDTGFFITDSDPNRANKIARIQDLSINVAPFTYVNVAFVPGLGAWADYFYGSTRPRSLALIASGMYSTLDDRTKFYRMMLNGGKYETANGTRWLLSPATISLLSHNRIRDLVPAVTFPPITNWKWGLGVAVGTGSDDGYTLAGQSDHSIFWSGLFGSSFSVDWGRGTFFNHAMNTFDILQSDKVKVTLSNLHYAALV